MHQELTRRHFARLSLAGLGAAATLAAKPNSKFGGVQIGINAPYSFRGMSGTADDILNYMTEVNLSAVELRLQPVEAFLGAPGVVASGRGKKATPADQEALTKWRLALSMDRVKEFRKKYEDAGVKIEIVKVDGIDAMPDEVVDYCFASAKALGAKAISCEIPVSRTKRLGAIAEHNKLMVGYHGHAKVEDPEAFAAPASWERAMSYSKWNGINLDIGHFIAGNNVSPVDFIRKHHNRITHIHLKDRKLKLGPNTVWGQGDTPVVEVLRLMKKEKYPFEATIEFEYAVPEGSTVLKEIARCVEFCRQALS